MIFSIILFISGILLMIDAGIYSKEFFTCQTRDILILSVILMASSIVLLLVH